jgi:hypothetical protein
MWVLLIYVVLMVAFDFVDYGIGMAVRIAERMRLVT